MKYTLPVLLLVLIASCKKNEPAVNVTITTKYKLVKTYNNGKVNVIYNYNADNLVKSITTYYYYRAAHGSGPWTYNTYPTGYLYDNYKRVYRTFVSDSNFYSSEYKYSTDGNLLGRYNKQGVLLSEYKYTSGRVSVINSYDINGKKITTEAISYSPDGNVTSRELTYLGDTTTPTGPYGHQLFRVVTTYKQYDDCFTIHSAMPAIGIILNDAWKGNNPVAWEVVNYSTGGFVQKATHTCGYKYNDAKLPVLSIHDTYSDSYHSTDTMEYFYQ
ncbi:MAG: hypothetical protein JNK00_11545 [Flavipsychrobacter sp.]|nr:hypothetical protein [Flavipsychrobacter sp.]